MSLKDWLNNGWLVEHQTSREEIADLRAVVERDLKDCRTPGLSADWRLNIAYNAALQAAAAALSASGYRAERQLHHYRVIQSLAHTVHADKILIARLDTFRKKRNISDYERSGMTSDQEAEEMLELAVKLYQMVVEWIREKHPELLEKD
jgi:uncharacterized damage-inducible protein DinB